MGYSHKILEEYIVASLISIENSQEIDEIRESIIDFGFGPEGIQEGRDMHTEFKRLVHDVVTKKQEKVSMGIRVRKKFRVAFVPYNEYVGMLRVHLVDDPEALELLGLNRPRDLSTAGFIAQATRFYQTLLTNDEVFNKITKFMLTREKLQAKFELVETYQRVDQKQEDSKGAFKRALAARDEYFVKFRKWMREYEKACRAALKDRPQLIERLAFTTLSQLISKRKKRTTEPTTTEPTATEPTTTEPTTQEEPLG